MVTIRKRKAMPMRNVPPTHAQLSGAPCVSTYERQSRSGTPVSSAMSGRERERCLSGGAFWSFPATVFRANNSAVIDGNVPGTTASEQRERLLGFRLPASGFRLPASGFRLSRDLRPDPLEALAHVRRPVGPVVLPGP